MGAGFSPLDEELAWLPGTLSPRLVESLVRLGTWMPFERGPAALAFFTGVRASAETARRLTETAGAALGAIEDAAVCRLEADLPAAPAGPPVQQLSADGAMVPLVGGEWAEVKTLAIGAVTSRPGDDGGLVSHTTDLSYFSRRADAETFGRLATVETPRRGTETAGVVCAVMAGAEWLQPCTDLHRPDAVRILDFPHAAGYVGAAAQAVWGAGTATASAWLGEQLHALRHGDPDAVIAAVAALPAEAAALRDEAVS